MADQPRRVFFETNIYIIGAAMAHSAEAQILRWAGYGAYEPGATEVVVSEALFDQIVRVARRLRNKD
jgi:hypothetical protein